MTVTVKCPTCKKPVAFGADHFPFCSDRCRLLDVGKWADEEYRIASTTTAPIDRQHVTEEEDEG